MVPTLWLLRPPVQELLLLTLPVWHGRGVVAPNHRQDLWFQELPHPPRALLCAVQSLQYTPNPSKISVFIQRTSKAHKQYRKCRTVMHHCIARTLHIDRISPTWSLIVIAVLITIGTASLFLVFLTSPSDLWCKSHAVPQARRVWLFGPRVHHADHIILTFGISLKHRVTMFREVCCPVQPCQKE